MAVDVVVVVVVTVVLLVSVVAVVVVPAAGLVAFSAAVVVETTAAETALDSQVNHLCSCFFERRPDGQPGFSYQHRTCYQGSG